MKVLFVLLFSWLATHTAAVVVQTSQGYVNGTTLYSKNGRKFEAFYGIPYAQPPLGTLRFQAPRTPQSWKGIKQAIVAPPSCMDEFPFTRTDEDCLYINVFTPKTNGTNKLPVMVFIYGGAFQGGSSFVAGPGLLLDQDVVLVSFNYRSGILGFLSAGNSEMPGNYGLKDQVAALKWVKTNIQNFGGDPSAVTLFGQSSGASCVHLHTLSPASKGLFHKAIMQSGSGFTLWGHLPKPYVKYLFNTIVNHSPCSNGTTTELKSCLQKLSVTQLQQVSSSVWSKIPSVVKYRPVVEPLESEDAFLTKEPHKLQYHNNSMPWIIGTTTAEGLIEMSALERFGGNIKKQLQKNYNYILSLATHYRYYLDAERTGNVSNSLVHHYFNDFTALTDQNICNLFTDMVFAMGSVESILSYPGPKYAYSFDYQRNGFAPKYKVKGAGHAADLGFIFPFGGRSHMTPEENIFSRMMVSYWTTMAATGNPNKIGSTYPIWKRVQSSAIEFMHLKNNGTKMETNFLLDRRNFWKTLPIYYDYKINYY